MAKRDADREKRLADALRENLRRRKAQARGDGVEILPGRGGGPPPEAVVEGTRSRFRTEAGPLHQPAAGPPPRSGED
jgi:glyoxylase-like metal-dependent hydrolase (beta-lactamase superfamily II)